YSKNSGYNRHQNQNQHYPNHKLRNSGQSGPENFSQKQQSRFYRRNNHFNHPAGFFFNHTSHNHVAVNNNEHKQQISGCTAKNKFKARPKFGSFHSLKSFLIGVYIYVKTFNGFRIYSGFL